MGLFSEKTKAALPWIQLESIEQLHEIAKTTEEKPILLFKHSTRCGISSMALNSFEGAWSTEDELCDLYYLDLLNHRDVSDEIAEITSVFHQSPQCIVIKGENIIYEESHSGIDARRIEALLKKG